ncbi:hypothetical protein [Paludisphaera borealis]|uniref:Uncharacterized protein n=1 Tax=Paludisphaera borealis TaxID=1387353 RepID=A0A1U7CSP5_9BACT|nr:hypothetical protein [Paludisphaera borealis]APW61964.1 hypothetical protein BSF38_03496 [Paludisphaera borealis]
MTAEALRAKVFAELEAVGFRPAKSLPDPDLGQAIRPPDEIAARLLTLDSVFTWAAFSGVDVVHGGAIHERSSLPESALQMV